MGAAGPDRFEDNFDFDHAAPIEPGQQHSLNFVPVEEGGEDNDFFKLWVKPGAAVTCETSDLGPGVDTNLILYNASQEGVGGNDDIDSSLLNLASRVTVQVDFSGWLYVLVGQGRKLDQEDALRSKYSLTCYGGDPTPTPTPQPSLLPVPVGALPPPVFPAGENGLIPPASMQSSSPISVPSGSPASIPPGSPSPIILRAAPRRAQHQVSVYVFKDIRPDQEPGAGEGVPGIEAALATEEGTLIAGVTDEFGRVGLAAFGSNVRLQIPYLEVDYLLQPGNSTIYIIVSSPGLP